MRAKWDAETIGTGVDRVKGRLEGRSTKLLTMLKGIFGNKSMPF